MTAIAYPTKGTYLSISAAHFVVFRIVKVLNDLPTGVHALRPKGSFACFKRALDSFDATLVPGIAVTILPGTGM